MANWCYTTIELHNKNKDELKDLFDKLVKWTEAPVLENRWDDSWLGNIVFYSKIGSLDNFRCSGSVSEMDLENDYIYITTETDWTPCLKMFLAIIDKYSPKTKLIYRTEEIGNGILDTNDECYVGKYLFDPWSRDIEEAFDDCMDEDYLISFLQRYYNTSETNVEKLLELVDEDDDVGFSIHQWEYTEASYWD